MFALDDILKDLELIKVTGQIKSLKGKVCFDSRQLEAGDLFVAVRGTLTDGHMYIREVIDRGAAVIVCEELPKESKSDVVMVLVEDSHKALAIIASNFYGNPSNDLKLVGITGTNGKTTIASLLFEITKSLGYNAGLLSTIKVKYGQYERSATHTTPDPLQLQSSLREMVDHGVEYVFMEVSSHAVHQKRIAGINFTGGVFTNLTHDHLDYHKTFSEYLLAKKAFFDGLAKESFSLTNADDKNAQIILQNTNAKKYSYGIKTMADFKARVLESHFEGNLLKIKNQEVWTQLPGEFNASNIMAIYGVGMLLGFDETELLEQISRQKSVEGRFEVIRSSTGTVAIVDYAHTPDALANVLKTIRSIRVEGQQIITIIGAGGNRDKTKRPMMARIAAEMSEKVVLTSDNPRNEEPETIIEDMKAGLDPVLIRKVISITDRDEAIKATCSFATSEDIILVAGKGHETYQEVKGKRHHFDDREKLKEYLML
jgi:UDP-N-acetylmuramoyl-L-alanyl-D-glutamate--2,6-diaminopimelate ligase